jgi:heme/copper-type cytochrome/quinol oxidase subunit 3
MSSHGPVTRSMEATTARAAGLVARSRLSIPNGVWAVVLLICTETILFGALIGSYFYLSSNVAKWPPAGIEPPSIPLPLAITGALALTAIPMFLASAAARRGRAGPTLQLVLLAFLVQAGYLAVQIVLFRSDYHKFTPQSGGSYGSIYFTMLTADHAHVAVGLLLDLWLMARVALGGLTNYRVVATRAIAWYWYFVGAATVAVTLTQLSPSL